MCRLFGLTTGGPQVGAQFWLLDAPDSLLVQSHRNPDGSGLGFFDADGAPVLDKQPEPAFADPEFRRQAKTAVSETFVAHVRFATAGGRSVQNTHPFVMRGRMMAHNGSFGELDCLDGQLGGYRNLVHGETDSERYFALITQQIDAQGGDVTAGIISAATWISANLPVVSLNAVLAMPGHLWALRYPDTHALHVLVRPAGRSAAGAPTPPGQFAEGMHVRSSISSVHSPALDGVPSVVVASEQLDGETGWRMLAPGELIHAGPGLAVESVRALPAGRPGLSQLAGPNAGIGP